MSGIVYTGPSLTRSLAAMFVFLAVPGLPESALSETYEQFEDDEQA
jgi:hypothetical protein